MPRPSSFCQMSGTGDPRPTATGWIAPHLPPGPQRDEALGLLRVGVKIAGAWTGRRAGPLALLVRRLVAEHPDVDMRFENLLNLLFLEAKNREHEGPTASCIESVDRGWQQVTYHHAKGRVQVGFSHVRNLLTCAKKEIHDKP